ncbi:MAG TPA: biotin/lipoyl-containing protein [Candidatus Limnocylindrales bacterium]|jgi:acetyl-CoA carboxylase biotin carboxyl carrier protein|nr:biotin/lipoyl-containing protein [Candidatus Limnocylindrales bacterium]
MTDDLEPMAMGPAAEADLEAALVEAATADGANPPRDDGDRDLLGLIDRLATLLDRSDLTELEVESGGTGLVLRKPSALTPITVTSLSAASPAATPDAASGSTAVAGEPSTVGRESVAATRPSIKAPLTGIFYASPAPGSAPYVSVGGEVAVGQIIGLIEAMKLFNEIKSDLAGRVVRVVAESGTLVKAKQPLIEVEPL